MSSLKFAVEIYSKQNPQATSEEIQAFILGFKACENDILFKRETELTNAGIGPDSYKFL